MIIFTVSFPSSLSWQVLYVPVCIYSLHCKTWIQSFVLAFFVLFHNIVLESHLDSLQSDRVLHQDVFSDKRKARNVRVAKFQPYRHQNRRLNIFSKLHVYLSPTMVNGARSLKAPTLNLRRDFPFDVVPSGKIIKG